MSCSSTSTAESCRQNRSASGKRVKHRGQTFNWVGSLATEPKLTVEGQEALIVELHALGNQHVEEGELCTDIDDPGGRELHGRGRRDDEALLGPAEVELGDDQLGAQDDRDQGVRVGDDADRRQEVGLAVEVE